MGVPVAVGWCISKVVLYPINLKASDPSGQHIIEEVVEARPSLAYGDASTSVMLILRAVGV